MMAAIAPRDWVEVEPSCWKEPLPAPLPRRTGILSLKGLRKFYAASADAKVIGMLLANGLKMCSERSNHLRRKKSDAVLSAFTISNGDLLSAKVHILNPQTAALEKSQAGAIKERRHDPLNAVQLSEKRSNFLA